MENEKKPPIHIPCNTAGISRYGKTGIAGNFCLRCFCYRVSVCFFCGGAPNGPHCQFRILGISCVSREENGPRGIEQMDWNQGDRRNKPDHKCAANGLEPILSLALKKTDQ